MKYSIVLFLVPLLSLEVESVALTKDKVCRGLRKVDCNQFPRNENCGTNGITYINACQFAQAKCVNEKVHIAYSGACVPVPSKTKILPGFELILQVVCHDIQDVDCSKEKIATLCASDRRTYRNYCYFEKARCNNHQLHVKYEGPCKRM